MSDKTFTCDGCEESWEMAFLCRTCSGFASELERLGSEDDEGDFARDICGNCCICHLSGVQLTPTPATESTGEDVPF